MELDRGAYRAVPHMGGGEVGKIRALFPERSKTFGDDVRCCAHHAYTHTANTAPLVMPPRRHIPALLPYTRRQPVPVVIVLVGMFGVELLRPTVYSGAEGNSIGLREGSSEPDPRWS